MKYLIEKWFSDLSLFCLAAAVVLMSFQIFLRFVFNSPLAWTEEVDRYLFVWTVYLGAAVAVARKAHIRVTFLIDLGGPKWEKASQIFDKICCLISFSFVAYFGFQLAYANLNSRFYTLEFMPLVLFYLSVPVSMVLMLIYLFLPATEKR